MRERLHPDDLAALVEAARASAKPMNAAARWVLGIAASILTLVLAYMGGKLGSVDKTVGLVQRDMVHLKESIDEKMGDRFTVTDAKAMNELLSMRFKTNEHALEELEARVAALEAR